MAFDWTLRVIRRNTLKRIDNSLFASCLVMMLSGCCARVATTMCPDCPVVVIQAEHESKVQAIRFEATSRFVHVDGTLFLSGRSAIPQIKLYEYDGPMPLNESVCKIVKDSYRVFDYIEQKCKAESSASEQDDRTVCVNFYRNGAIPISYPVRFALYQQISAELRLAIDNDASDNARLADPEIGDGTEPLRFADINCLGTDIVVVPDYAVLLAARDGVFTLACVYYRGEVNPVRFSRTVFFSFLKEDVKLRREITIEEFRTDIVAKMSDCVNSTRENSSWKFRLVCWSTR